MKQTKWILILVSALSLQANAFSFQKNVRISKNLADSSTPIRTAKIRVTIYKTTLTPNPQGGYDSKDEKVCTSAGTVNVYDFRPSGTINMGPQDLDRVTCTSTIGGANTTLHIGSVVALESSDVFGASEDAKLAASILYYDLPGSSPGQSGLAAFGVAGSTDLNVKSLVAPVAETPVAGSSSPTPINEYFQAVVDSED